MTDATSSSTQARAGALVRVKRFKEAIAIMSAALATNPGNASLLCMLASAQVLDGDPAAGLETSRRAIAASPDNGDAHLAHALAWAGLGRPDKALPAAQECLRITPRNWRAHVIAAEQQIALRKRKDAEASARKAVRLAPNEAGPHSALGHVLMARAKPHLAVESFRQALGLDPANPAYMNNLGVALRWLGNEEEAMKQIRAAAQHGTAEARRNLFKGIDAGARRGRADPLILTLLISVSIGGFSLPLPAGLSFTLMLSPWLIFPFSFVLARRRLRAQEADLLIHQSESRRPFYARTRIAIQAPGPLITLVALVLWVIHYWPTGALELAVLVGVAWVRLSSRFWERWGA